ncbi:MAG TPA: hypothetical protein VIK04_20015 [Solirubrobacteraceae bacterium]
MVRTLLTYFVLRRLRRVSPELFDGARALAAINACIEQELVGYPAALLGDGDRLAG